MPETQKNEIDFIQQLQPKPIEVQFFGCEFSYFTTDSFFKAFLNRKTPNGFFILGFRWGGCFGFGQVELGKLIPFAFDLFLLFIHCRIFWTIHFKRFMKRSIIDLKLLFKYHSNSAERRGVLAHYHFNSACGSKETTSLRKRISLYILTYFQLESRSVSIFALRNNKKLIQMSLC